MDDGEVEISDSDHVFLQNSDSLLDELLRNAQTCTHTHTCNPPGPYETHTHTCYHTHTQLISQEKLDDPNDSKISPSKPKRNSGNREAVRKYREKQKAQTAYLEEEVKKLRYVNQQLSKNLQKQAVLESEILRLRGILFDLRCKIDGELGDCCGFGFSSSGAMKIRCEDELHCLHHRTISMGRRCFPAIVDCQSKPDDGGLERETQAE